jgi:uncharacterized protein YceH (UPF0502 family)
VLLLRGPQTAGEIRGRTNRLAEFANVGDVETALEALGKQGLVAQMLRRPGQKEVRYAHLLSGAPESSTADHSPPAGEPVRAERATDRIASLEAAVVDLRSELAELRARFNDLARQFE